MIVLTVCAACVVMWVAAPHLRDWRGAAACALLLIGVCSPAIWAQAATGYATDSYWTLKIAGRIGVLAISAVGIALFYTALWRMTRHRAPRSRSLWIIAGGAIGFALLHSLAPQAFYSFYQLLFPDLPRQWVINGLIDFERLSAFTPMPQDASLSDHLSGAVFWSLWPFAIWGYRRG